MTSQTKLVEFKFKPKPVLDHHLLNPPPLKPSRNNNSPSQHPSSTEFQTSVGFYLISPMKNSSPPRLFSTKQASTS
ncbi:hypothetical protein GQ457_05G012300 [Hibiscus cannabinus]